MQAQQAQELLQIEVVDVQELLIITTLAPIYKHHLSHISSQLQDLQLFPMPNQNKWSPIIRM
jgi:hypothetical protein